MKEAWTINYYDTEYVKIGTKKYCVYCGETPKHSFEYEGRDKWNYYYCDCEGANFDREMQILKRKLNQLKCDSRYFDKLRYEHELEGLQYKYRYALKE